jgi:hypothetical protein
MIVREYLLDAEVVVQWLTGSGPWRDQLQWLGREYIDGRCRLAIPDVALLDIVAGLRRLPQVRTADVATALSLLGELRLELKPLTIGAAARAEALMRLCGVGMMQAIYMALGEQMGRPWVVAEMTEGIQQWGMALSLQELPGTENTLEAQEVA